MIEIEKCYPERIPVPDPNPRGLHYILLTYKGEVYIQLEDVIAEMGAKNASFAHGHDKRYGFFDAMERLGMPLIEVKQGYIDGFPTRVFRVRWLQVRALAHLEEYFFNLKKECNPEVRQIIQGEVLTEYLSRRTAKGYQWDGDAFPPYVEPFQELPMVRDTGD